MAPPRSTGDHQTTSGGKSSICQGDNLARHPQLLADGILIRPLDRHPPLARRGLGANINTALGTPPAVPGCRRSDNATANQRRNHDKQRKSLISHANTSTATNSRTTTPVIVRPKGEHLTPLVLILLETGSIEFDSIAPCLQKRRTDSLPLQPPRFALAAAVYPPFGIRRISSTI